MHDPEVVRPRDASRQLDHDGHRTPGQHGPLGHQVREGLAVQLLHHDVGRAALGLALIEDLDHVGVRQRPRGLGLAPEALADGGVRGHGGVHDLHGARPVDQLVGRPVYGRHTALADDALDQVPSGDRRADEGVLNVGERGAVEKAVDGILRISDVALGTSLHPGNQEPTLTARFAQARRSPVRGPGMQDTGPGRCDGGCELGRLP